MAWLTAAILFLLYSTVYYCFLLLSLYGTIISVDIFLTHITSHMPKLKIPNSFSVIFDEVFLVRCIEYVECPLHKTDVPNLQPTCVHHITYTRRHEDRQNSRWVCTSVLVEPARITTRRTETFRHKLERIGSIKSEAKIGDKMAYVCDKEKMDIELVDFEVSWCIDRHNDAIE